jgi:hypothetical protein
MIIKLFVTSKYLTSALAYRKKCKPYQYGLSSNLKKIKYLSWQLTGKRNQKIGYGIPVSLPGNHTQHGHWAGKVGVFSRLLKLGPMALGYVVMK